MTRELHLHTVIHVTRDEAVDVLRVIGSHAQPAMTVYVALKQLRRAVESMPCAGSLPGVIHWIVGPSMEDMAETYQNSLPWLVGRIRSARERMQKMMDERHATGTES